MSLGEKRWLPDTHLRVPQIPVIMQEPFDSEPLKRFHQHSAKGFGKLGTTSDNIFPLNSY